MNTRFPVAILGLLMTAAAAAGSIELQSPWHYYYYTYRFDAGPSAQADFMWDHWPDLDTLDQEWWWLRIEGSDVERPLSEPHSVEIPTPDHAVLAWNDFWGSPIRIGLDVRLSNYFGGSFTDTHTLTITNNDTMPHRYHAFHYIDIRGLFDAEGHELAYGDGDSITIEAGGMSSPVLLRTSGASAFQVGESDLIRALLDDSTPTDLDHTGLPFGPGRFSAAHQWRVWLDPGQSATFGSDCVVVVPDPGSSLLLALVGSVTPRRREHPRRNNREPY